MMKLELIKKISIRGRMVLALDILNEVFEKRNIDFAIKKLLFKTISKFTTSNELDTWHEKVKKIVPEYLMNIPFEGGDYFFDETDYNRIYYVFSTSGSDLLDILTKTIWLGIITIYNNVGEYSEDSYLYVVDVINLSNKFGIKNIDIDTYTKYKFDNDSDYGWGEEIIYTLPPAVPTSK